MRSKVNNKLSFYSWAIRTVVMFYNIKWLPATRLQFFSTIKTRQHLLRVQSRLSQRLERSTILQMDRGKRLPSETHLQHV